jgi:hypothetical protein
MAAELPIVGDWSSRASFAGWLRGHNLPKKRQERQMKKYVKPSLTGLGLLRDVTKFSGRCNGLEINDVCITIV